MGADALTDAADAGGDPPAATSSVDPSPNHPSPDDPPPGGEAATPPGAEGWSAVARRVSGIVLLVVIPVQLALTRVFEDPAASTVPTVRDQWSQPGWRLLECLFFVGTAVHVVASVRVAVAGSRWGPAAKTAVVAAVASVAVATAVFASAVVLTAPW